MKCQTLFSGKIKRKYFKMLSAENIYPACSRLSLTESLEEMNTKKDAVKLPGS